MHAANLECKPRGTVFSLRIHSEARLDVCKLSFPFLNDLTALNENTSSKSGVGQGHRKQTDEVHRFWIKTDDFGSYVFRAYLFSCCPAALFCWYWATSVASERSILWCPAGLGVSLWKRTTSSGCAPSKLPFMKRFAGHADCRCPKLMIVPHATSTRKDRNREEVRKDDSRGLKRWEGLVFHVRAISISNSLNLCRWRLQPDVWRLGSRWKMGMTWTV